MSFWTTTYSVGDVVDVPNADSKVLRIESFRATDDVQSRMPFSWLPLNSQR